MDGPTRGKGRVEASMMKQIAGRAGRRSSQYRDQGLATCLNLGDMAWLREAVTPMTIFCFWFLLSVFRSYRIW
jgi:hypothetical protein